MLAKKRSGDRVEKGDYWNFETGERIHLSEPGILPGNGSATYFKASPWIMVFAAPLLGLAFAIFFPLVGILVVALVALETAVNYLARVLFKSATFNWRPSEAYLAKRKARKQTMAPETTEPKKQPSEVDGPKQAD